jgi:hypothetical protein
VVHLRGGLIRICKFDNLIDGVRENVPEMGGVVAVGVDKHAHQKLRLFDKL